MSERLEPRSGYEALARVLDEALEQAQSGKGHERHADAGQAWTDQPIFQIPEALGPRGPGFNAGQYAKKLDECWRLPPDARRRELLGAVVYAASLVLLGDERSTPGDRRPCLVDRASRRQRRN